MWRLTSASKTGSPPYVARSGSGTGLRVVRVGAHGLKVGSRSTLWGRLSQHRGTSRGSGNHRGSIFRLLVGVALARQQDIDLPPSWAVGGDLCAAGRRLGLDGTDIKSAKADLETRISRHIGNMPFLWLGLEDEPGPASQRGLTERNAIALLSAYREPAPDSPSADWFGHSSDGACAPFRPMEQQPCRRGLRPVVSGHCGDKDKLARDGVVAIVTLLDDGTQRNGAPALLAGRIAVARLSVGVSVGVEGESIPRPLS